MDKISSNSEEFESNPPERSCHAKKPAKTVIVHGGARVGGDYFFFFSSASFNARMRELSERLSISLLTVQWYFQIKLLD